MTVAREFVQPGQIYNVRYEDSKFQVEARRRAPLAGWWFCRGVKFHELILLHEDSLYSREPAADQAELLSID